MLFFFFFIVAISVKASRDLLNLRGHWYIPDKRIGLAYFDIVLLSFNNDVLTVVGSLGIALPV